MLAVLLYCTDDKYSCYVQPSLAYLAQDKYNAYSIPVVGVNISDIFTLNMISSLIFYSIRPLCSYQLVLKNNFRSLSSRSLSAADTQTTANNCQIKVTTVFQTGAFNATKFWLHAERKTFA